MGFIVGWHLEDFNKCSSRKGKVEEAMHGSKLCMPEFLRSKLGEPNKCALSDVLANDVMSWDRGPVIVVVDCHDSVTVIAKPGACPEDVLDHQCMVFNELMEKP